MLAVVIAVTICLPLLATRVPWAEFMTALMAGKSMPARMPMTAMTISSSMSVNAESLVDFFIWFVSGWLFSGAKRLRRAETLRTGISVAQTPPLVNGKFSAP